MRVFLVVAAIAGAAIGLGPLAFRTVMDHVHGVAGVSTTDERRLAAIASSIAGRPVRVECRDWASWQVVAGQFPDGGLKGFVEVNPDGTPGNRMLLSPSVCRALSRTLHDETVPPIAGRAGFDVTLAITALAHESFHLRGVRNEAVTQCYALQNTRYVALRLGATAAYAKTLATLAYYRYEDPDDTVYFTPECVDGGKLDLHPDSAVWP